MNDSQRQPLFPEFEKFAVKNKLIDKSTGSNRVKFFRILGQGKTKAKGLDLPPASIERMQEIISLESQEDLSFPSGVIEEIQDVKKQLKEKLDNLKTQEGVRRFSVKVLKALDAPTGNKNNHFFAGRFILVPSKGGKEWAWSLTKHYPIVSKIPPDIEYLIKAHSEAQGFIEKLLLPVEIFRNRLDLSWTMARHFSESLDKVLIRDVARMFKVAGQDEKFWNNPRKSFFIDRPEAAFIVNLMQNITIKELSHKYDFVSATLHQSKQAFYFPEDNEGTLTRPMIYMRKKRN